MDRAFSVDLVHALTIPGAGMSLLFSLNWPSRPRVFRGTECDAPYGPERNNFVCWAGLNSAPQETRGKNPLLANKSRPGTNWWPTGTFQKIPPPPHRHRPAALMASAPSTTASTLAPPLRSPFSSGHGARLPTTLRLPPPQPSSARWRVAPAPAPGRLARARVQCGAAVKFIGQSEFEAEVLQSELPVLVDFVADWCGPCRLIAPVVDWASEEYEGRLKIVKIDHDANPQLIGEYKVYGLPALILFKNGQEVPGSRREGAITKQKFKEYVEPLLVTSTVA